MDIDLIMDVLEKHGIANIDLAGDIQTLAKESYLDGKFDAEHWWAYQDQDEEWVAQWELAKGIMEADKDVLNSLATGEEITNYGDIPYQPDLHSKLDVEALQKKQIENGDLKDAINQFLEEYDKLNLPPGSPFGRNENGKE